MYSNTIGYNNTASGYQSLYKNTTGRYNVAMGYASWTTLPSDAQFKLNVEENVKGLVFIKLLRPVSYNVDQHKIEKFFEDHYGIVESSDWSTKYDKEKTRYSGFIAQEVEQAARYVGYEFSGVDAPKNENDFYGILYAEFVVPLVKALHFQF